MTCCEAPNWNEVEPSAHVLINNVVPVDDIKCFDQLSHLKKFTVSHLSDEDFTSLLAH